MTERQGVGMLYNIPHLGESFITHCLFYRFTHRAPRKMPPTPKSSTFFTVSIFPLIRCQALVFFDPSLSIVKSQLSILQTIVDILYSFVHINDTSLPLS